MFISDNIKFNINVNDNLVGVMKVRNINYISLTDLARYKNNESPGDVIIKWMSNKNSFDFYSLWEELFNLNFKLAKSREFKKEAANRSFTMSPFRWKSSLEVINSEMLKEGINQQERLERLNKIAIKQLSIIYYDNNIKKINNYDIIDKEKS